MRVPREDPEALPRNRLIPCPDCTPPSPLTGESIAQVTEREYQHVPALYASATLDNWIGDADPEALRVAREYVAAWRPKRPLLTLASARKGNGKTHLGIAVIREMARRHGVTVGFYVVPDLMDRYRAANARDSEEDTEAIDRELQSRDVLMLDELGLGRQNDFVTERVYAQINGRYSRMRPLIVTTNVFEAIDDRVRSRLADKRVGTLVVLSGPDRRPRE